MARASRITIGFVNHPAEPPAVQTRTASGTPSLTEITAAGVASKTGGVTITDVNTTESWTDGDTGLVITGTGFV